MAAARKTFQNGKPTDAVFGLLRFDQQTCPQDLNMDRSPIRRRVGLEPLRPEPSFRGISLHHGAAIEQHCQNMHRIPMTEACGGP